MRTKRLRYGEKPKRKDNGKLVGVTFAVSEMSEKQQKFKNAKIRSVLLKFVQRKTQN